MSASGGSRERQPHRIGGSARADPDGDSGLDSATSGEQAIALYEALPGPAAEEPTGLWASSIAEVADLDLWLTLTEPGLTMDAGLRAISATLAMRAANPREDVTP